MLRIPLPNRSSDSPAKKIFRYVGLIAVFIVVGILFWNYYERSLDQISVRQNIWDQTQTLNTSDKQFIQDFSRELRSRYGLTLTLKITEKTIKMPKMDAKTLFIGLCPAKQESIVILPPLLKNALPADFVTYLKNSHFKKYWDQNMWPSGLKIALRMIWEELANLKTD